MTKELEEYKARLDEVLQHSIFVQTGCEPIMQAAQALLRVIDALGEPLETNAYPSYEEIGGVEKHNALRQKIIDAIFKEEK